MTFIFITNIYIRLIINHTSIIIKFNSYFTTSVGQNIEEIGFLYHGGKVPALFDIR